jgi:hypothetical protein
MPVDSVTIALWMRAEVIVAARILSDLNDEL